MTAATVRLLLVAVFVGHFLCPTIIFYQLQAVKTPRGNMFSRINNPLKG